MLLPWQVRGRPWTQTWWDDDRPWGYGAALSAPPSGQSPHWEPGPGNCRPVLLTRKEVGRDCSQRGAAEVPAQSRQKSEHSRTGGGEEREMAGRDWKGSWGS